MICNLPKHNKRRATFIKDWKCEYRGHYEWLQFRYDWDYLCYNVDRKDFGPKEEEGIRKYYYVLVHEYYTKWKPIVEEAIKFMAENFPEHDKKGYCLSAKSYKWLIFRAEKVIKAVTMKELHYGKYIKLEKIKEVDSAIFWIIMEMKAFWKWDWDKSLKEKAEKIAIEKEIAAESGINWD